MSTVSGAAPARPAILIAEDSAAQAALLRAILTAEGYPVRVARNGAEALRALRAQPPALVLSDIFMPDMDGYALCRQLKNDPAFHRIPVILVTALADPADVIRGLACGADNFMVKPYEERALLACITSTLATPSRRTTPHPQPGLEVVVAGQRFVITADRPQILQLLLSTHETAVHKNGELARVQATLQGLNDQLEAKVRERTAALEAEIAERQRAEQAVAKHAERLRILHEIDRALIAEEAPEAIAAAVIQPLRELLGVPRAIVNLFDLAANEVEWLAAAGRHRVHRGPGIRFSLQFMGDVEALRRGEVQVIDTRALPPGPAVEALLASGVEVYMVVPMIAGGELIGALSFGGAPGPFPAEQVSIAREAATQLAIVLAQARLYECVQQQAERMRLFSTAVESSADAILTETLEGIITGWNPAAERLYGFAAVAAVGQHSTLIVPADRQAELRTILAQLHRGEQIAPFETIRVHKDGARLDVSLTMSPVTTSEGVVLGVSAIARDITAQKQLQEQLRHAQKMEAIGQLTGGLAHDFNNLLGVIVGNLDLLDTAVGENAVARKRIQTAQRAAMRGAGLTRRLLAFARRQHLTPVPTGVNDLITELLAMLPRTLGPDIAITTQLAVDLPLAQIDPAGLENALLNLAINARDAMPGGGTLTLATKRVALGAAYPPVTAGEVLAGTYVWIAVSDTGHGMAREVLAQVFEPFFTTKPRDQGTGLGLAMVYGFVKQSSGHIRIYSEPGHGTSVHLYVPVAPGAAPPVCDTPTSPHTTPRQGTVLVVDDEVDLLEVAVTYLEEMGCTALAAVDGPSALEVVARTPALDLLLTDVIMPGGMNGVVLARQIRQQHPDVAVIYASGFPSSALVERRQLQIDGPLIDKPYRKEQLAAVVHQALASRSGSAPCAADASEDGPVPV